MEIGGVHRKLLIDSGSEISILKKPIAGYPIHPSRVVASGITGAPINLQGEQELECRVHPLTFSHRFVIADVISRADGIMGWDLLSKVGFVIDAAQGQLVIKGVANVSHGRKEGDIVERAELRGTGPNPEVSQVQAVTKTVIPPFSEIMVEGKLKQHRYRDVLVEPIAQPQHGIRVARSLNRQEGRRLWVRMVNLTGGNVVVAKGQHLGLAEAVNTQGGSGENEIEGRTSVRVQGIEMKVLEQEKLIEGCLERLSHLSGEERAGILEVLKRHIGLFGPPGKEGCRAGVYHKIRTTEEGPVVKRPYRVPFHQRDVVADHIRDMLEGDVICPSTSPWSAPVVLVEKKCEDGSPPKYRFCTDFRGLNKITKTDAYPLPLIVETLERLGRSKYFSTLDLTSGYHQIPIWPEDREKTAFTTAGGHYEYKKMAFGLVNAPATFQRLMDQLLAEIKGEECLVYLDDIIIYSATIEEHCQRLERVLVRLENANLRVNLNKCTFAQQEVRYLGHLVTAEGVKPDPGKVEAVANYPVPQNSKELKAFLGLCGYYRRFVRRFADLAKPLTQLLRKEVTFQWGESQQQSFQSLKEALCSTAVLIYPDFRDPFMLSTDASGVALGAVLSQMREGHERPIAYASRQLSAAERNYSTTERELLAVVWATAQFRCYLLGRRFTLVTDHSALRWMLHLKDPSARLTRWSLRLAEFTYEVVHKPGVKHANADALSRTIRAVETTRGDRVSGWRAAQRRDEWCRAMVGAERIQTAKNGLLYRAREEGDRSTWQVLVPKSKRVLVISHCHGTAWSGHPGVKRTIQRVRAKFYWPQMSGDVKQYVRECRVCQERKTPAGLRVPLAEVPGASRPFEQVSLDIVGPLPSTAAGNRYLLTIIDWFSRYAEAVPLKEQSAEETARAFVDTLILRHGAPERVLTDQGRNFTSELFRVVCKRLGIRKLQTTAYHPEGNGLVERLHRTLTDSLACIVRRDGRDWDRWVPYALMAYRTTPHSSIGYSPHFLIHGRELRQPFECELDANEGPNGVAEFIRQIQKNLGEAYQHAKDMDSRTRRERARTHDRGKRVRSFNVGDKVYLYEPAVPVGHARKFRRPWTGPHSILARISPVNYELTLSSGGRYVVHVNRLKPAETRVPSLNSLNREEMDREEFELGDSRGVEGGREGEGIDIEPVSEESSEVSEDEGEASPSSEDEGSVEELTVVDDPTRDPTWSPGQEEWDQTEAAEVSRLPCTLRCHSRREVEPDKAAENKGEGSPNRWEWVNTRPRFRNRTQQYSANESGENE